MTPNAYVRAQAQSGSKATGNTRRLSDISQSSSDDDLNPDTLTLASVPRNKVVASAKKSSLSMLGSPGKGRKAVIADSEEEEDDVIIVQTDDEEEAPVPKKKNRPSGPRVSNVSAGTNGTGSRRSSLGTPISAKAAKALSSKKGKGRAVEEEEEEQSYVYNDEGQEYSEEEQQPAYDDEEEVVPVPRKLLKNGKGPAPKTKVRAPVPVKRARHNDSSDEENADGGGSHSSLCQFSPTDSRLLSATIETSACDSSRLLAQRTSHLQASSFWSGSRCRRPHPQADRRSAVQAREESRWTEDQARGQGRVGARGGRRRRYDRS